MTHVEMPFGKEHHLTLVHFSRTLTPEEGQTVLNGLEDLANAYAGLPVNAWWGFNDLMVGPRNNVPASGVEFETNLIPEFRERLVRGLRSRGLPVSQDYATWVPHITNPPKNIPTWTFNRHKGYVTLVQKPHRINVEFPAKTPADT